MLFWEERESSASPPSYTEAIHLPAPGHSAAMAVGREEEEHDKLKPKLCRMQKNPEGYGFHLNGIQGLCGQHIKEVNATTTTTVPHFRQHSDRPNTKLKVVGNGLDPEGSASHPLPPSVGGEGRGGRQGWPGGRRHRSGGEQRQRGEQYPRASGGSHPPERQLSGAPGGQEERVRQDGGQRGGCHCHAAGAPVCCPGAHHSHGGGESSRTNTREGKPETPLFILTSCDRLCIKMIYLAFYDNKYYNNFITIAFYCNKVLIAKRINFNCHCLSFFNCSYSYCICFINIAMYLSFNAV